MPLTLSQPEHRDEPTVVLDPPRPPAPIVGIDDESVFWRGYIRIGNGVLIAESAMVVIYLAMTRARGERAVLLALAVATMLAGLVPLVLSARIATRTWRVQFALAWTLLSGVVLAVFVHMDHGLDSPLLGLMVLPIMYAALAMRPSAVAACCLIGLGELIWIRLTDPDIHMPQQNLLMLGAVLGGVAVLALVSSINRARLEAREKALLREQIRLAEIDGLTGCLNHRAFTARLDAEVERAVRHRFPLSLLVADVDLLKRFNDMYGHQTGDAALKEVGAVLIGTTRSIDVSARVGGDEFAVILPHTELADAHAVATRIADALQEGRGARVTMSIGAASLDPGCPTSKQLFHDADAAMYRAKGNRS
jgi:diguanylate cyclase (GGDEF)-like protein